MHRLGPRRFSDTRSNVLLDIDLDTMKSFVALNGNAGFVSTLILDMKACIKATNNETWNFGFLL